jgi:pyridoxal phosphate enzyme (YggS family)
MSDLETLRRNLAAVRERVARAAERAGRRPEDVLLIGVSKTVPPEGVRLGVEAGLTALGENRVQEARDKIKVLGRPVPWHLIGHLQTNKVRDARELFDLIHSVDRLDLARELDRRAGDRVANVLLEVNVANEPSKSGFAPDAVAPAVEALRGLPHLNVRGLMAIPPIVERAEDARVWFQALRRLAEHHGLRELSMGMSADFEVAIEEGATMVRVGTAIFGARPARTGRATSSTRQKGQA